MSRFEYASRLTNAVPGMRALSATSLSRPGWGAWIDPRLEVRRARAVLNWSIVALGDGGIGISAMLRPAALRLAVSRFIACNDCCRPAASDDALVTAAWCRPSCAGCRRARWRPGRVRWR